MFFFLLVWFWQNAPDYLYICGGFDDIRTWRINDLFTLLLLLLFWSRVPLMQNSFITMQKYSDGCHRHFGYELCDSNDKFTIWCMRAAVLLSSVIFDFVSRKLAITNSQVASCFMRFLGNTIQNTENLSIAIKNHFDLTVFFKPTFFLIITLSCPATLWDITFTHNSQFVFHSFWGHQNIQ